MWDVTYTPIMVIKEWKCAAHGYFESAESTCPHGCTTTQRVFLTPPAHTSDKTKGADAHLRKIAAEFGLTDMRSAREGESARIQTKQQRDAAALQQKLQHRFAPMIAKGGTFEVGKGVVGGGPGQGALAALKEHGAPESSVISQIKPMLGREIQNGLTVKRDPDRDSVAKIKATA